MLRVATSAVIACLLACSGKPPEAPRPALAADTALRIRIARAEARRGAGLAELVELAARGAPPERRLALRALGRIGGAQALEVLRGALADADAGIAAAAAGALGVAASLDELDEPTTAALTAALLGALPRAGDRAPIVLEALGRAADASAQPLLAAELRRDPARAEAAAIALGRHGRRKIPLATEARVALAAATQHAEAAVRYAAVWALGREQLPDGAGGAAAGAPDPFPDATARLIDRLDDKDAEIRAQAIAALTRRKRVEVAWRGIEGKLTDLDWRVAVEAVRALTGAQSDGLMRAAAARGLAVRAGKLVRDEREAQVVIEGLRGLLANSEAERRPEDAAEITAIADRLGKLAVESTLPAITRGWIGCLASAVHARRTGAADFTAVERCGPREFPDHLRRPLLAELIKAKAASPAVRRSALGALLAHADVRVRAAGMGALAALWPDGDDPERRALVAALIGGISAPDPILAGTAVDAAPEIYDLVAGGDHEALDAAVLGRAASERDVELATSLFDLIGKRKLAAGAAACRTGLGGHPVRARAAAACLAALGEAAPAASPAEAPPAEAPPVDVAAVIGRSVRWKLVTSRGPVTIELRPDAAPWAVATIVALTRKGFYDNLEFHRVVPDFVVQGGDPTQSGWGGPGFLIPAEPSDGTASGYVAGGVGIADAGRDSGGSQWFVMHARAPHLDGRYTWIGRVTEGQSAADALQIGDRVVRAAVEVAQ
jgi:cyclophilin family peptidyl-prolyl cis-trans isomerase